VFHATSRSDLDESLPTIYHLGVSLGGLGGKTPTGADCCRGDSAPESTEAEKTSHKEVDLVSIAGG
jgi:hypothetical protein